MTLSSDLLARVRACFKATYKTQPKLAVQAPARVNLIGEHTDYNDGFVLPCAIDYQTIVCASPRDDGLVNVVAADCGNETDTFTLGGVIEPHPTQQWANYVRGVVKHLHELAPFGGADIAIGGNVPLAAGLSSSASLEVAVGQAFKALYDLPLSQTDLALNGQKAENLFVGCNCGIMDQLISAEAVPGAALLIDCRSLEKRPVAIPHGITVMIINSNVRRGLVESEYNTRRKQCEEAARFFGVKALRDISMAEIIAAKGLDPLVLRRARHVVSENARTLAAADALAKGDMKTMALLMAQSHISMRDDFEITHPAVDALVEIVKNVVGEKGGVRMTGGGFGGCVVALLPDELVDAAKAAVEWNYRPQTGLEPTVYICRPQAGAGRIGA